MYLHFRNYDYEFYYDTPQTPLQKIKDFIENGKFILKLNITQNVISYLKLQYLHVFNFEYLGLNNFKSGNLFQDIDRQFGAIPPAVLFAAVAGSIAAAGVAAQTGIAEDLIDGLNNFLSKYWLCSCTNRYVQACIKWVSK